MLKLARTEQAWSSGIRMNSGRTKSGYWRVTKSGDAHGFRRASTEGITQIEGKSRTG